MSKLRQRLIEIEKESFGAYLPKYYAYENIADLILAEVEKCLLPEKREIDREDRVYNGLPSKLMNMIYDGLVIRNETIITKPYWAVLSLYLARTCGVIENNYLTDIKARLYG